MADRNTPMMDAELVVVGVAGATLLEAGKMGAVNATGYAVPAADAAGLTVLGRIETYMDNRLGSDGDESVTLRRKRAFKYDNDGTNPVTIAHVGKTVYVADAETVSSDGGTNSIAAGKCVGLESDGVWIEIA